MLESRLSLKVIADKSIDSVHILKGVLFLYKFTDNDFHVMKFCEEFLQMLLCINFKPVPFSKNFFDNLTTIS